LSRAQTRAAVLAEARRWIGTPYQHQASCRGAGTDCLGLVRGIWRALYGDEPCAVPPYRPDWDGLPGAETLLQAAQAYFEPVPAPQPGDLILFRPRPEGPAKHCAILSAPDRILHAYWGRCVAETSLNCWWRRRQAAAFAFPELET
jgi:NlpC/P60 family putative phage cell wall peptidase